MAIKQSLNIIYDRVKLLKLRKRSGFGLFDPITLNDYPELAKQRRGRRGVVQRREQREANSSDHTVRKRPVPGKQNG